MVIPPFEASLNIDRVAVAISGGSRVDAKLPDQQGVGRVDEPWRDLENTSVSATLVTLNVKRGFTHCCPANYNVGDQPQYAGASS